VGSITKVAPGTTDGYVQSNSTVYNTARAGASLSADTTSNFALAGQEKVGSSFFCDEAFFQWAYTAVATNEELVTARIALRFYNTNGTSSVSRNFEVREKDWSTSLTTADWVAGDDLANLDAMGAVHDLSSGVAPFKEYQLARDPLLERIRTGVTPLRVLVNTDRHRNGNAPTGEEYGAFASANYSSGTYASTLALATMTLSDLSRVGACSIQLSDGTAVFLDGSSGLDLNYATSGTGSNAIASIDSGSGEGDIDTDVAGWQTITLCRDDDDNLFVIGKVGSDFNTIVIRGYEKGVGYSWTEWFAKTIALPAYGLNTDVAINNLTAVWHNTSNLGHIVVVAAHHTGQGDAEQMCWASLSVNNLVAGINAVAHSGVDPLWLGLDTPTKSGTQMTNDVANGLDSWAVGRTGFTVSFDGVEDIYGQTSHIAFGKYTISTTGTISSAACIPLANFTHGTSSTPDTYIKLVPIGSDRLAVCFAGRIRVYNFSGSLLGSGTITAATGDLYATPNLDYAYDPVGNKVWAYFVSSTRTVSRQPLALSNYSIGASATVGNVGVSGDTCNGLRIARGQLNERHVRVDVGLRSSGGVYSVGAIEDSFNVVPDPPVVGTRADFDATNAATFTWSFFDDNTDDSQTAYQLQIFDLADDSLDYDSLKTASVNASHILPGASLANSKSYYWKVRTYDLADAVSSYSAQGTFQTLSTAITTITTPAADNPEDAISSRYTVAWSTTVIVQAKYRLVLVNTQTGVTELDTGYVTSTDTSRELSSLENGVTYRVEVTVRNSVDVTSTTGTRLITPAYANPPVPTIDVTASDSYVQIVVTNPEPGALESNPDHNDVYRAEADSDAFIKIAEVEVDGTYKDYAVRSGRTYQWKVDAVT
jgi:hypothetical protein